MFLEDGVHFRRRRAPRRFVELPPVPLHLKHRKRPVHAGGLQQLLPIHCRLRERRPRPRKQPDRHTYEDSFATHCSPPLSTLAIARPPPRPDPPPPPCRP